MKVRGGEGGKHCIMVVYTSLLIAIVSLYLIVFKNSLRRMFLVVNRKEGKCFSEILMQGSVSQLL